MLINFIPWHFLGAVWGLDSTNWIWSEGVWGGLATSGHKNHALCSNFGEGASRTAKRRHPDKARTYGPSEVSQRPPSRSKWASQSVFIWLRRGLTDWPTMRRNRILWSEHFISWCSLFSSFSVMKMSVFSTQSRSISDNTFRFLQNVKTHAYIHQTWVALTYYALSIVQFWVQVSCCLLDCSVSNR